MIAVDTNVLVYAHRRDSPWHQEARDHIRQIAEGPGAWAIPWPCIHEFLSIVTHPRIYDPPSTLDQALEQVAAWCDSPVVVLLAEGSEYWEVLRKLLLQSRVAGSRVHDARVAALCMSHGVRELWTADRDFGRFPGLVTRNPLVS